MTQYLILGILLNHLGLFRISLGIFRINLRRRITGNKKKELVNKPGSVMDNHLSRMFVTKHLKQPTRA